MKLIFFLLFSCFAYIHSAQLNAQTTDIVQTEGVHTGIHRKHLGKILFTANNIPLQRLQTADFLQTYTLTNKSNLYFIAFMGNSITNYLHRLSPSLTADTLVKTGNYQFALFVDNKLIYQSNLLPGAPYAKIQDSATVINKPLINNEDSNGLWSESFWNRFMHFGGDSALTEGRHTLSMEIRPYLKTAKIIVGDLIAKGDLNVIVARKPVIDIAKIRLSPLNTYPGLEISKDHFDKNRIKELIGNINEGVFKKISGIVVLRNGKILLEEYFNGETRSTLHDPRSVGKSFASTLTGIAIHEHYLTSEYQQLKEFYDLRSYNHYSPAKERVTLKDLLTMHSVFDGNDEDGASPGNEENMYPTDNWVKFTLDLPTLKDTLSNKWHYFTAGVVLLGDILNRMVPGGLEKYADLKLFKPLGIRNYQWEYTPQNVPNTAGGLQMNALDFAKYGQLYKNGGKWDGKQLIPSEWVTKTFTRQQQIKDRNKEYYGYLFWNKSFEVKDKRYEAFYCAGNGGNYIIAFKDQPLVIVVTAKAYGQFYAHPQVNRMITEFILPAIVN